MNKFAIYMCGSGFSTALLATSVYAQSLELRPILKDRFEYDCAIREIYDFHNDASDLQAPLKSYVIDEKHIERMEFKSHQYTLKNVVYADIPIRKIEFTYGNIARQYNEYLYFDLTTDTAKKKFKAITFPQNLQNNAFKINEENKQAVVSCYWLDEMFRESPF